MPSEDLSNAQGGPAREADVPGGEMALLFVYGTLRHDCGTAHHLLPVDQAALIGKASVCGRLYDVGDYPALVAAAADHERVIGELYRLTASAHVLDVLDRYEGCAALDPLPHEFDRRETTVTLADGSRYRAWVYWYQLPCAGLRRITSGDYAR